MDERLEIEVRLRGRNQLTQYDPQDLHPIPAVAESWESTPDAMTWTFHLRANAQWSNGEALTARDFLYAFRRILSPALAAEYAYFLFHLKNGEAFSTGKVADFAQVGASAPNEDVVPFRPQWISRSEVVYVANGRLWRKSLTLLRSLPHV